MSTRDTCDIASSKCETADYSVLTVWVVCGQGSEATVEVVVRGRLTLLEFVAHARRLQRSGRISVLPVSL